MDHIDESIQESKLERKKFLLALFRRAAIKLKNEGDPWKRYNLQNIPAERAIRHLYHPTSHTWSTDETIVKIEKDPFTHGAMRYCYRMKKRSSPPNDATNHHFHKINWSYASNYVAKAYIVNNSDGTSNIDTSDMAKQNVKNDIMLQYEAQYWAEKYNQQNPPKTIHFLRAYAIEFPDREGRPWFAVERFITGTDTYGAGYTKHNTNAGFVDHELRRVTPQIFSAYTFYASFGHRLVADIQGIGDLYTDPQVLSSDYRFGEGDLGPRGMAFFMTHFRNCTSSDALGIPTFHLSKNEIKRHQTKYDDDEITLSDEETDEDDFIEKLVMDRFQKLDLNRRRRSTMLQNPIVPEDVMTLSQKDTMRRSNRAVKISFNEKPALMKPKPATHYNRSKSDVDDIHLCIERAKHDHIFSNHDFHRHISGELKERQYKATGSSSNTRDSMSTEKALRSTMVAHKSAVVRNGGVAQPMPITDDTRMNLGRVHYQLAVLHGAGRFPEIVSNHEHETKLDDDLHGESIPDHDVYTVLFHLSYAASFQNPVSCLALGRILAGQPSQVSPLLTSITSIDFESSKSLLHRAMTSPYPPTKPKVAAGCQLYQVLVDEQHSIGIQHALDNDSASTTNINASNFSSILTNEIKQCLEETIQLMTELEKEDIEVQEYQTKQMIRGGTTGFMQGDQVEANYALEGTFYPAVIEDIFSEATGSLEIKEYGVRYEDDGTYEKLSSQHVRVIIPPTATQTSLGGPLSDEEAFSTGSDNGSDDSVPLKKYELQFALAQIMEQSNDYSSAASLYEVAADGAVADGKMKIATSWSLKAAELQSM